jgi:voltage-gated potassium channel
VLGSLAAELAPSDGHGSDWGWGMSLSALEHMDPRRRRRLIVDAALRTSAIIALLLGLYAALPVAGRSDAPAIIELLVGLCAFVALLSLEVRVILRADYPWLRAAEALVLALAVLIIVFAFTYLSLSRSNEASFSEPLDHVGAMYFTVTILSTVGFGDIAAKTDLARITVTLQILMDIALVVVVARAIVFAARVGVRRKEPGGTAEE